MAELRAVVVMDYQNVHLTGHDLFAAHRGLPSPEHDREQYARNLAQRAHWERDPRVRVTSRPLKYDYQRDASGRRVLDAAGRPIPVGRPREKGIDVLCALAVVREAADPATDLVILASRDSDLRPALDEALDLGRAKIETTTWHDPLRPGQCRPLRPDDEKRRLWNTRLSEPEFHRTLDRRDYL